MRGEQSIKKLTSIVAIDRNGAIGCDNNLPWRLKTDMSFFRTQTTNNTVVMGRKTYDSLGGKPLPKRNNIVLSHNAVLFNNTPVCQLALSVEEALFRAAALKDEEVFIIGGAQTYAQFDDLVDRYLITVVEHEVPNADAFLSENVMASLQTWQKVGLGSYQATPGQDEYAFSIYEVTAPDLELRHQVRRSLIAQFKSNFERPKGQPTVKRNVGPTSQDAFAF
ncbi:MAG: dihydrofolate reductase [Pseudomonadota bacterium]